MILVELDEPIHRRTSLSDEVSLINTSIPVANYCQLKISLENIRRHLPTVLGKASVELALEVSVYAHVAEVIGLRRTSVIQMS